MVLTEGLEIVRDKFQPSAPVHGYLYPDGRIIANVRFVVPKRGSVRRWMIGIEEAWYDFPEGTWFEGSFLFDRASLPPDWGNWTAAKRRAYECHYQGMNQIQTFGTQSSIRLFNTMRGFGEGDFSLLGKLHKVGYGRPSEILFRVGRTIDNSKPFEKKKPPA